MLAEGVATGSTRSSNASRVNACKAFQFRIIGNCKILHALRTHRERFDGALEMAPPAWHKNRLGANITWLPNRNKACKLDFQLGSSPTLTRLHFVPRNPLQFSQCDRKNV